MRPLLSLPVLALLLAACSGNAPRKPVALKSDMDSVSYVVGLNISSMAKQGDLELNADALMDGFLDGRNGKPRFNDACGQRVMAKLQSRMANEQKAKMAKESAANKKAGEAFLAENKAKSGVVTLKSGLQYKVLTEGTGPKPKATDMVVCNYSGSLIDGKVFDSSFKHGGPATFPVSGVIKGWTEALQLMPVGSKWQLVIPSELAYGSSGAGSDIGPDAVLVFEIELLGIKGAK